MPSLSRMLMFLAGALISAVVLKRKETSSTDAKPWRADLDDLHSKILREVDSRHQELAPRLAELQPRIEALAARLATKPDGRIDEVAAHLARLQPKIEALARELAPKPDPRVDNLAERLAVVESKADCMQGQVDALHHQVAGHDRLVLAVEQLLTSKMTEIDQRIEAQGRSLEAMNSSIAQSDELLERVLDMVQNLSPAGEPREPISMAAGGGEIRQLQL